MGLLWIFHLFVFNYGWRLRFLIKQAKQSCADVRVEGRGVDISDTFPSTLSSIQESNSLSLQHIKETIHSVTDSALNTPASVLAAENILFPILGLHDSLAIISSLVALI